MIAQLLFGGGQIHFFLPYTHTGNYALAHMHSAQSPLSEIRGNLRVSYVISFHALTGQPYDRMRNLTFVYLQETDKSCHVHTIHTLK